VGARACFLSGNTHPQNGKYYTSFVPAALVSGTFQITVEDPVSRNQTTELKSTTQYKRVDTKVYISETTAI